MDILVVGNGGREHAIAWKIAQSKAVNHVYVAPGNAGTALEDKLSNVDIQPTDIDALLHFAQKHSISLTIIGPEAPLAAGIVDQFNAASLPCFGPTKAAAQLESSKHFSKAFMEKHHIPTAQFGAFTKVEPAIAFLKTSSFPIVIKANGLAAGKGVVIAENLEEAEATVKLMLTDKQFGQASHEIIIESFLEGEELSFIVMVDGKHVLPLASSQDHKRRDDGDHGPNTGGMGAYSPAALLTDTLETTIMERVILPTVQGMAAAGTPYTGFLYAGLMIAHDGTPNVLEFNCRLGDPETQAILMRLQSDLVTLCLAALDRKLNAVSAKWNPQTALTVVMASGGYPGAYEKGHVIERTQNDEDTSTKVFHAGTKLQDGNILTNGGRVLGVTALGENAQSAQENAYKRVKSIHWKDCFYRNDIGYRAITYK